jgi:hypothetical protein
MEEVKTFWTCPNCSEQVEEQFEACWNCQHNRDGFIPAGLSTAEGQRETTIPTHKAPDQICLRCQTNMIYAGRRDFHEGTRWGMFGDFAEFFVNQTKLEMYYCPACRHVEFFV